MVADSSRIITSSTNTPSLILASTQTPTMGYKLPPRDWSSYRTTWSQAVRTFTFLLLKVKEGQTPLMRMISSTTACLQSTVSVHGIHSRPWQRRRRPRSDQPLVRRALRNPKVVSEDRSHERSPGPLLRQVQGPVQRLATAGVYTNSGGSNELRQISLKDTRANLKSCFGTSQKIHLR